MAKSIKGTQTEKNLLTSFAGESQARMRYTYFASVAKKEGYEQISAIFTETADQEKEHAKRMFKFLEGGMVEITASYPAGVIGTTLENLRAAAAGEHEEWSLDYPHFADVAEQEGFPMIAAMYRNISIAEKGHEERYLAFVNNIENMTVFATLNIEPEEAAHKKGWHLLCADGYPIGFGKLVNQILKNKYPAGWRV